MIKVMRNGRMTMKNFISLLKYYFRSPAAIKVHVSRFFSVMRQDGFKSVVTVANERMKLTSAQTLGREYLEKTVENRQKHVDTLLTTLTPHAHDLSTLEITHDPYERVRSITCHLMKKYGVFDEEFYRRSYLSKHKGKILPMDHYMKEGAAKGLKPNAYIDPIIYLSNYSDVGEIGMDPALHFAIYGWAEGRTEGVFFDGMAYYEANPDVVDAKIPPLIHYLQFGRAENRPLSLQSLSESTRSPVEGVRSSQPHFERKSGTIVLVSHDAELGGAQQVIRVFAEWIKASTNYDVKFIVPKGGAFLHAFREIAPTFNLAEHADEVVSENLEEFVGDNVKALFLNSIASMHVLDKWTDDTTPVLGFIHELPKILHMYEDNVARLKSRADTVICGSEAVRTALRDEFDFEVERLERVYGFIENISEEARVDFAGKSAAKLAVELDATRPVITACGVLHWRKSPDKFIETAEQVVLKDGIDAQFVWIGGGPDQEECEALVKEKGLTGNVLFTGYEPNIMRYLNASDVFLLPSQEDPFPLVCLYSAMALNPVICFKDAGGMPEFVAKGCGKSVKFGDAKAMAKALKVYLEDKNLRLKHGRKGRELVEKHYSISATGPELFHYIRSTAKLKPHASVVVPNYNYEDYLPARLDTIFNQTFQDFELILLDDKSPDESVRVLQDYADRRPGTKLITNEDNSGSPFSQWIKGMRLAQSDLVWMAEADDTAEPNLLETLLPHFEDRNVFLGYCKSVPTRADGSIIGDYEDIYLNRINDGRWSQSYTVTDHEEASLGLGRANCIPNASSMILRNFEPDVEFETTVTKMKLCGDWLFYLRAMKGGKVAYNNAPLNYHRRHDKTVTHSVQGSNKYFDEFALTRAYVNNNYILTDEAKDRIKEFTIVDMDRFGVEDVETRDKILKQALPESSSKTVPSVLFVTSDLSPGGGQNFALNQASEWAGRGGRAAIFNVRHFPDHPKVLEMVDPRVSLFNSDPSELSLSEVVSTMDIDLVQTSLWWAEKAVHQSYGELNGLPWVTSMHGCHETIVKHPEADPDFASSIAQMKSQVSKWVYTAEKNREVFDSIGTPEHLSRIRNGVKVKPVSKLTRKELGLRQKSVVLCLATRAIESKGWKQAVSLTQNLNKNGHMVDLMLIGEGPMADKYRLKTPKHVHLYGQVSNIQDYIDIADIGLLPSFFLGESMPLILLEMMAQGKAIVTTDVGDIPDLIGEGEEAAGLMVPLTKSKTINQAALNKAVKSLLLKRARTKLGKAAKARFDKHFRMDLMMDEYAALYDSAIEENRSGSS